MYNKTALNIGTPIQIPGIILLCYGNGANVPIYALLDKQGRPLMAKRYGILVIKPPSK